MLTEEDKETLRYLKQSSDALKRDAVELIERLGKEVERAGAQIKVLESKLRALEYFSRN